MTKVSTIGYEGIGIDDFIATLLSSRIKRLIDVRDFPGSRKRGFSKTALANSLAKNGIEYTHLRWLGDPKDGRDAARKGDYKEFRRIYFSRLRTKSSQDELALAAEYCSDSHCALMCYESDPTYCHRSIVAVKISQIVKKEIAHLDVICGAAKRKSGYKRIAA